MLISSSYRTIHIGNQKSTSPEPTSSKHNTDGGLFQVEQQRPRSARKDPVEHEDLERHETKPVTEQSYMAAPQQAPSQVPSTILTPSLLRTEEEWEAFARPIKLPDGTPKWQCRWRTMDDGVEVDCRYESKKQLVKRHVETTHLKYK